QQRRLAAALDGGQAGIPSPLLEECRASLMAAMERGEPSADFAPVRRLPAPVRSPWRLFLDAVGETFRGFDRWRQPVGAVALVVLGFFTARFAGMGPVTARYADVGASPDVFSTVRSIQPDSAGHVRIALDETRRREIDGRADDPGIQKLLLAAAAGNNPAVRVISVSLLAEHPGSSEVRDVLINALRDSNRGVRMNAIEGLKPLAGDPLVRKTLAGTLVSDDDPAMRIQAINLLVTQRDEAMVGILQGLVQNENNDYVRLKCEQALKEWNASVGTF
ncbi:MAG TPA: HEAT repeat domain-containing protein, partial [Bryobacteraceae bacterium]|nr:HEAT repeat domain-containing protein [Bryobacteraceae bacterium]